MLGKHLETGYQLAAAIFFAQAVYHLLTESERVIFSDDLQTGLLFVVLSYLQRLYIGRKPMESQL